MRFRAVTRCTKILTGAQLATHVPTTTFVCPATQTGPRWRAAAAQAGLRQPSPHSLLEPGKGAGQARDAEGRGHGPLQPALLWAGAGVGGVPLCLRFIFSEPLVKLGEPRPTEVRAEGEPSAWEGQEGEAGGSVNPREEGVGGGPGWISVQLCSCQTTSKCLRMS